MSAPSHTPATPDPHAAGLLSLERLAQIRARREALPRADWQELPPVDHEGCSIWPWEDEESLTFAYEAPADVADMLTHIAARDAQMTAALRGLLTSPEILMQLAPGGHVRAHLQNTRIHKAARALGLTL